MREHARGYWAKRGKQRGENLNTIEPEIDVPDEEPDEDEGGVP
jgi:hypothetical protein